jgi:hypothetical protein
MKAFHFLFAATLLAQNSSPGFRLGYTRRIYVEALGTEDGAKLPRDHVIGALLNRTKLSVDTNKTRADAILIGTGIVTSGYRKFVVGSSNSEAAAVAVATPSGAAAGAATSSSQNTITGGGIVRISELGLQLTDQDGRILWAFDPNNCRNTSTMLLTGVPTNKDVTVCAAEQLARAIDKDAKAARSSC